MSKGEQSKAVPIRMEKTKCRDQYVCAAGDIARVPENLLPFGPDWWTSEQRGLLVPADVFQEPPLSTPTARQG